MSSFSNDASNSHSAAPSEGGTPQVDNINWNLDAPPVLGSGLDDIDMDFATLFDTDEQLLSSDGAVAGAQQ
jgi:hypothetical protein